MSVRRRLHVDLGSAGDGRLAIEPAGQRLAVDGHCFGEADLEGDVARRRRRLAPPADLQLPKRDPRARCQPQRIAAGAAEQAANGDPAAAGGGGLLIQMIDAAGGIGWRRQVRRDQRPARRAACGTSLMAALLAPLKMPADASGRQRRDGDNPPPPTTEFGIFLPPRIRMSAHRIEHGSQNHCRLRCLVLMTSMTSAIASAARLVPVRTSQRRLCVPALHRVGFEIGVGSSDRLCSRAFTVWWPAGSPEPQGCRLPRPPPDAAPRRGRARTRSTPRPAPRLPAP